MELHIDEGSMDVKAMTSRLEAIIGMPKQCLPYKGYLIAHYLGLINGESVVTWQIPIINYLVQGLLIKTLAKTAL